MGNVFNRYGAGGGKSEGLYIWKKYSPEYTDVRENIKATKVIMENVTENVPIYSAYEYTFDTKTGRFTLVNPTLAYTLDTSKPFDGFSATRDGDGAKKYYMVNGYIGNEVYIPQSYNYPFSINYWDNDKTVKGELQINTSYFTRRYADPILTFLDYVVSDKEDEYPDKEEKDGYYYEKVKYGAGMFGGDKVVAGTITPTSNARSISIPNTVGTIPKLLMIESANQSSYFNYGLWIFDNTGVNGVTGYCSGSTGYSSSASGTANATTITPMVKNTSSNYFQADTKLAYVVVY